MSRTKKYRVGARVHEVEEPGLGLGPQLFRSEILLQVEFNEVAEPKALIPANLIELIRIYGNSGLVAQVIGASEAFVRQNSIPKRKE